ncbi:MAG: ribbon-helix-helix protein, CopG family [Chthoniobacter sp.]|uniref:ribbon-helix-helix protein, CopG family n=1 Tax=Chthoniobacter sp. TaxID=2510640 RepID=UPI0032AA3FFB
MTTLSLKLPEPMADRLAAEARARRKPKSALVREFIERGLTGPSMKGRASFHALAKDKAARFRGPRDLATNPKHMEDFGR